MLQEAETKLGEIVEHAAPTAEGPYSKFDDTNYKSKMVASGEYLSIAVSLWCFNWLQFANAAIPCLDEIDSYASTFDVVTSLLG